MQTPNVIGRALLGLFMTHIAAAQISDTRLAAVGARTSNDALGRAIARDETCYVRKAVVQTIASL
jgi:hypothetical protein